MFDATADAFGGEYLSLGSEDVEAFLWFVDFFLDHSEEVRVG